MESPHVSYLKGVPQPILMCHFLVRMGIEMIENNEKNLEKRQREKGEKMEWKGRKKKESMRCLS